MMIKALIIAGIVWASWGLGGCTGHTQRTPTLTAPPVGESVNTGVERKGFLQNAGDTTWNVVTAPARLVSGAKKPPPKAPETYEPAEAVIVVRGASTEDVPTDSGNAATRPSGQ